MIDYKELRCGNIILKRDQEFIVDQSNLVKVARSSFQYFPTPLTEEILLKCGLKIDGNKSYWMPFDLDRYIQLLYSIDGYYPTLVQEAELSGQSTMAFSCNKIEYLHQLQNLTHALTGKELQFKP